MKFLFGVRALQLGEFIFDFAVAGFEIQLFRLFEKNLIVDELIQNIELLRERFLERRFLSFRVYAGAVVLVDLVPFDFLAVDDRPHVGRVLRFLVAAGGDNQRHRRERQPNASLPTR